MKPRQIRSNKSGLIILVVLFSLLSFMVCTDHAQEGNSEPAENAAAQDEGAAAPAANEAPQTDSGAADVVKTSQENAADVAAASQADVEKKPERITDLNLKEIEDIPEGMEGEISLDLRNIDVVDALKFLSMKAQLNVIATKDVTGRITLIVDKVKIKNVFDLMLRSNGLAYAKEGGIYNIMTEAEYKAVYGKRFSDIRVVKTFKLQYAIPEQAFSLLDALKSEIGRVLVEPDSGTAMVMDTPDKLEEIEKALATLEQKNLVKVVQLKYAKAKDVEEQLKPQLDAKKVGTIKADERSAQVTIQALPGRMPDVERIIAALDQKTKEVLIETKIIKIRLGNDINAGVKWEGLASMATQWGMTYFGAVPFAPVQKLTDAFINRTALYKSQGQNVGNYANSGLTLNGIPGEQIAPGTMHVGIIDEKRDLDATIKYVQNLSDTQIIANPKISVINNQEARVHIGEKQAYVTTTTTTGQSTSTVSEEVTFVDVGIQLAVTPTINDDGYITMKIKPEISSVTSELITPSGNKIPIIDTSMAETTVMVKDGSTIIIGGLRKDEKKKTSTGIPFLSKIPILGMIFKESLDEIERTELLIMITPTIIEGDRLTTGDEKDFKYLPGKDYKKYGDFTEDVSHGKKANRPEDRIRSYKEYSDNKKEDEAEYVPKGIKNEQD
jgi:Type II secretory pathway, component PulD